MSSDSGKFAAPTRTVPVVLEPVLSGLLLPPPQAASARVAATPRAVTESVRFMMVSSYRFGIGSSGGVSRLRRGDRGAARAAGRTCRAQTARHEELLQCGEHA